MMNITPPIIQHIITELPASKCMGMGALGSKMLMKKIVYCTGTIMVTTGLRKQRVVVRDRGINTV